jgi:hypothetical protein
MDKRLMEIFKHSKKIHKGYVKKNKNRQTNKDEDKKKVTLTISVDKEILRNIETIFLHRPDVWRNKSHLVEDIISRRLKALVKEVTKNGHGSKIKKTDKNFKKNVD